MLGLYLSIIILIVLIVSLIFTQGHTSYFRFAIKVWVVLMIVEGTLFNLSYFITKDYKEINITNFEIAEGIRINNDNSLTVIDTSHRYIDIKNINEHIDNIYIKLSNANEKDTKMNIAFGFTDAANSKFKSTPSREVLLKDNRGETIKLNLVGKTKKFRIYFNGAENFNFYIDKISFNRSIEYNFSTIRIMVIFLFISLLYALKNSQIFKYNLQDKRCKRHIITALIIQIVFFTCMFPMNGYFIAENFEEAAPQRNQYKLLAESFSKGKVELDVEPSQILKDLKNPYDTKQRKDAFADTEETYLWDVAFYNNKYYVYFGVAPVIVYYLPFYLITGTHIKTCICDYITGILLVIGIFILIKKIASIWFKNTSLGTYLFLTLMMVNGCGLMQVFGRPDHYFLPIVMGVTFAVYGLISWLKAYETDKYRYYFLGSLCMASIAACRPQLLLAAFLSIPLFKDKLKEGIFSKKNIKRYIAFLTPFIMVAIPMMIYNYVRFSSPFDFGANYNLTTNDMTKRGWVIRRIPLGLFYYLFNPINFSLKFPFVYRTGLQTNYMGTTIYENMGAGFLITNAITLFAFTLFNKSKKFKDKKPWIVGSLCTIFAVVIMIVDTQMAGILPRYFLDFGFFLYIAAIISVFASNKEINSESKYLKILKILFVFLLIYNVLFQLSDGLMVKYDYYYYVRSLFELWV